MWRICCQDDDREDHASWGENAIGLVTYVATDRVVCSVLITAEDGAVARPLRSLDDERTSLAWDDGKSGTPIITAPDRDGLQPKLRLHFITSGIEIRMTTICSSIRRRPNSDLPDTPAWQSLAAGRSRPLKPHLGQRVRLIRSWRVGTFCSRESVPPEACWIARTRTTRRLRFHRRVCFLAQASAVTKR